MKMEDLIVAGSGPAGLTAAIYAARAELKPLVVEGSVPGGQLIVSHEIENYPGFPESVSGSKLMELFKKQAERFGAGFLAGDVTELREIDGGFGMRCAGNEIAARALIIASGAEARRLPIPSEPRFYGRGVSGCATCDGAFYRDQDILVVGGGNTAMEDALFLTRFARTVTIVHRRDYLRADAVEIQKARNNPKIKWMIPWVVEEITGDTEVSGAVLLNKQTGEKRGIACTGIFTAIGHDPRTEVFRRIVECDDQGYIKVRPGSTRTNVPGIFACGDVCDPVYKQAVVAAGTGCMAALDAQKFLESLI